LQAAETLRGVLFGQSGSEGPLYLAERVITLVNTAQPAIRSFFLEGPAGRLEAILNAGAPSATHAGIVCHPHPLGGGTMHNKVVFHAMKALNLFGFPVLRFNFRGTGLSAGKHDDGRGEIDDVRAALAWLKREFGLPIFFAGFSFGSATGLRAACPDPDVKALISIGTPVEAEGRVYSFSFLRDCVKPKLFVSGDHDQYGPHALLEEIVNRAADPKELVFVPGDHFFEGHLAELRMTIESWLQEQLAASK
jgi:alpha/beta superfamily hydrolase